jgi:hypothetical protein
MPSPAFPADLETERAPAIRPAGRPSALSHAIIAAAFALLTVTRADADLWGHLRFGLDLIRDGALTATDPYSFTQDKPWVNHEWLSELCMGLAYQMAGPTGLVILKASMLTAVFAIVWVGLRGASMALRSVVVMALALGTIHMTSSIRPQVWTLLAIAVLCRTLLADRPAGRWWLPALFAIWVNCHGGWIVGLGVLGVWAAVDVLSRPERLHSWTAVLVLTVAATLVNPYGWGLWAFLGETVRMSRNISEWGPLWGTPFLNWLPWIAATAAIPWCARRSYPQRWHTVAVLAMLSYAALRVMRIESIFVTAAAIFLAPAIKARWPARATPVQNLVTRHQRFLAAAVIAFVLAAGLRIGFRPLTCIGVWSAQRPDQLAAPALRQAQPGRLVTFFDWGQYAIWHFGPRLRVSMDGRRETVYSDLRLEEHAAILEGTPAGLAVLADWRPEYVWLPISSDTTAQWLRDHGYRMDIETPRSFVAVRADLPRLAPAASDRVVPAPACFPG